MNFQDIQGKGGRGIATIGKNKPILGTYKPVRRGRSRARWSKNKGKPQEKAVDVEDTVRTEKHGITKVAAKTQEDDKEDGNQLTVCDPQHSLTKIYEDYSGASTSRENLSEADTDIRKVEADDIWPLEGIDPEDMDSSGQNGDQKNKILEMMSLEFNSTSIPEGSFSQDLKRSTRMPRLTRKRKSEVLEIPEKGSPKVSSPQQPTGTASPKLITQNPITSALKKVRKESVDAVTTPTVISPGRTLRSAHEKKSGGEKECGEEGASETVKVETKVEDAPVTIGKKRAKAKGKLLVEDEENSDSGTETVIGSQKSRSKTQLSSEESQVTTPDHSSPASTNRSRCKKKGSNRGKSVTPVGRGKSKSRAVIKEEPFTEVKVNENKNDDEKTEEQGISSGTLGKYRGKVKIQSEETDCTPTISSSPNSCLPICILTRRSRGKLDADKDSGSEVEIGNQPSHGNTPVRGAARSRGKQDTDKDSGSEVELGNPLSHGNTPVRGPARSRGKLDTDKDSGSEVELGNPLSHGKETEKNEEHGKCRGKGKVQNEDTVTNVMSTGSSSSIHVRRTRAKTDVDKEGGFETDTNTNSQVRRSMTPVRNDSALSSELKLSQQASMSKDLSQDLSPLLKKENTVTSEVKNQEEKQNTASEVVKNEEENQNTLSEIGVKQEEKQNTASEVVKKQEGATGKSKYHLGYTKTGKKKRKHFRGLRYSFQKRKKYGKDKLKSKISADIAQETDSHMSEEVDIESVDSSSQDVPSEPSLHDLDNVDDGLSEFADNEIDNAENSDAVEDTEEVPVTETSTEVSENVTQEKEKEEESSNIVKLEEKNEDKLCKSDKEVITVKGNLDEGMVISKKDTGTAVATIETGNTQKTSGRSPRKSLIKLSRKNIVDDSVEASTKGSPTKDPVVASHFKVLTCGTSVKRGCTGRVQESSNVSTSLELKSLNLGSTRRVRTRKFSEDSSAVAVKTCEESKNIVLESKLKEESKPKEIVLGANVIEKKLSKSDTTKSGCSLKNSGASISESFGEPKSLAASKSVIDLQSTSPMKEKSSSKSSHSLCTKFSFPVSEQKPKETFEPNSSTISSDAKHIISDSETVTSKTYTPIPSTSKPEIFHRYKPETSHLHKPITSHIHKPETSHLHKPETSHLHKPETSHLHKPETSHQHKPETSHLHKPETSHLHKPVTSHLHKPVTSHLHKPVTSHLHKPVTSHLHKPETSHQHKPETSHLQKPVTSQLHKLEKSHLLKPEKSQLHKPEISHLHKQVPSHPFEKESLILSEPKPCLPSEPESCLPSEPEPRLPSEPDPRLPSEPESCLPSEPDPCLPLEPKHCIPSEPEPCLPLEPKHCLPSKPEPCLPSEPEPCLPSELEPCLPSEPEPCLPSEPEPSISFESEPSLQSEPQSSSSEQVPQPSFPSETDPSLPSEPQPSFSNESEPSFPSKTQPSLPSASQPSLPFESPPSLPCASQPSLPSEPQPSLPSESQPALPIGSENGPQDEEEEVDVEMEVEEEREEGKEENRASELEGTNSTTEETEGTNRAETTSRISVSTHSHARHNQRMGGRHLMVHEHPLHHSTNSSTEISIRTSRRRRQSINKRKLDDFSYEGHNSDSSDSMSDPRSHNEGVRKSKRLSRNTSPHPLAIAAPHSPEGGGRNQAKPISTPSANVTPVTPGELQSYSLPSPGNLTHACHQRGILQAAAPTLTNVLCKCQLRENAVAVDISGDVYCQAVDSFDGRMIGCCNVVSSHKYFRVSGKIPFMLLCDIHRRRLRQHNCCPCCGLFCTQGVFYECSWDCEGARHYYHKLCGLVVGGATLCPHCGASDNPQEVHLEMKLSRKPVVYLKQHQERKESSARMTWTKQVETPEEEASGSATLPDEEPTLELKTGFVISAHKLPLGPASDRLRDAIRSISLGKTFNNKPTSKTMYTACKQNDLEKLLHVLLNGLSPNVKVRECGNQTGLHVAAAYGSLAALHILILSGATIDMTDTSLMTPLMVAITKEQDHIVHYLVQAGASLMAKTQDGMTCLHLAAKCGNLNACQHILDSGRLTRHAVNTPDEGGWTPLVWASENKYTSVVKFLLDRGGNPQMCDVEQNTALHWAAFSGSTQICSMVLDRGCSLRSMNAHGDTPLHIAARQNHTDAVVLLLARGAQLEIVNTKGQMPIDCALPDSDVHLQLTLNSKVQDIMKQNNIRTEKILSSDIAGGKEEVPIPCVNGVDDANLPKDYLYIAENCEASNVIIDRTITSLKWCECEDGCNTEHCGCGQLNFQCWFDPDGRLLPEFNYSDPPMIFECNRACRCNKLSCNNRVVQHGISAHMQLFRTVGKGWGVRALKTIQKGSYVCEYVGEIITDLEADQRQDDSYLFDLDNRDSETFCIDARSYGNIARFINHLCEANLTPVKVFIDHQDLTFPRIALFANRDIEADEELGFDYGEKFWMIKYKHFTCTCMSEKCKYSSDTIQTTLENYNRKLIEQQEAM